MPFCVQSDLTLMIAHKKLVKTSLSPRRSAQMKVMKAHEKKSCAAAAQPVFITTFVQEAAAEEMDVRRYVKALTLIHIFSRGDN